MADEKLKHPDAPETAIPGPDVAAGLTDNANRLNRGPKDAHPSGKESYGRFMQVLRLVLLGLYFLMCCVVIHMTQLIGAPLYFVNREWYYAYMAMTKKHFAIATTVMTQIWGPSTIRISGDESVAGQIRPTREGGVQFDFPERMIMIANHQIYTDWLYLWWVGYANTPAMHGHIYIILKESLKLIPVIGWGMLFYGFIFMSRKMATDQPRMAYRLNKLKQHKVDPNGKSYLDPMWLLLFPEGTNLSGNGRRNTGMFFCLKELKGTIDYVYDCTVAYEGIPRGKYGEDFFGLQSTYFQGRPPKSVNFYWRRFPIAEIPLEEQEKFDLWLRDQWYKKDALMEEYITTGRFPAMAGGKVDFIETSCRTRRPWEILQIFSIVATVGLHVVVVFKVLHHVKPLHPQHRVRTDTVTTYAQHSETTSDKPHIRQTKPTGKSMMAAPLSSVIVSHAAASRNVWQTDHGLTNRLRLLHDPSVHPSSPPIGSSGDSTAQPVRIAWSINAASRLRRFPDSAMPPNAKRSSPRRRYPAAGRSWPINPGFLGGAGF
ncbi:hypothetical protein G7046_g539 [Stylonectria norvegica]|nr:hypothetical protein G7046_g539 [Stylonectria norvegica]